MLELKSRVLEIKFNDTVCSIKYPTVRQHIAFTNEYEKVEKDAVKSIECIIDFLVKQGLNQELAELLESEHLNTILLKIGGGEKK